MSIMIFFLQDVGGSVSGRRLAQYFFRKTFGNKLTITF